MKRNEEDEMTTSPARTIEERLAKLEAMAHPPIELRPTIEAIVKDLLRGQAVPHGKTLADYARHKYDCGVHRCRHCGKPIATHPMTWAHDVDAGGCSCGLNDLLRGQAVSAQAECGEMLDSANIPTPCRRLKGHVGACSRYPQPTFDSQVEAVSARQEEQKEGP